MECLDPLRSLQGIAMRLAACAIALWPLAATAEKTPAPRRLWCAYNREMMAFNKLVDRDYGSGFADSFIAGDEITVHADIPTAASPEQLASPTGTLPAQTTIFVQERIWSGDTLVYRIGSPAGTAFIDERALDHLGKDLDYQIRQDSRRRMVRYRYHDALVARLYAPSGLVAEEVYRQSQRERWTCWPAE
ncbi:MAG: hypothetical protein NVV74_24245 [Magnetospirillum sp.]|nr:hypothetical protein [Magnetospirillum sp.]